MACLRLPLWFHGYIVCRQIRGQFYCLAQLGCSAWGLFERGVAIGRALGLLVSAQRQLRVIGTDIVRTPDTLAGPCKFFGDIVAYQRNQEAIHPGLWDAFNLWERLRARSRR